MSQRSTVSPKAQLHAAGGGHQSWTSGQLPWVPLHTHQAQPTHTSPLATPDSAAPTHPRCAAHPWKPPHPYPYHSSCCTHTTRRSRLWNAVSCTRHSQLGQRMEGRLPAGWQRVVVSQHEHGMAHDAWHKRSAQQAPLPSQPASTLPLHPARPPPAPTCEGAARVVLAPVLRHLHFAGVPAGAGRRKGQGQVCTRVNGAGRTGAAQWLRRHAGALPCHLHTRRAAHDSSQAPVAFPAPLAARVAARPQGAPLVAPAPTATPPSAPQPGRLVEVSLHLDVHGHPEKNEEVNHRAGGHHGSCWGLRRREQATAAVETRQRRRAGGEGGERRAASSALRTAQRALVSLVILSGRVYWPGLTPRPAQMPRMVPAAGTIRTAARPSTYTALIGPIMHATATPNMATGVSPGEETKQHCACQKGRLRRPRDASWLYTVRVNGRTCVGACEIGQFGPVAECVLGLGPGWPIGGGPEPRLNSPARSGSRASCTDVSQSSRAHSGGPLGPAARGLRPPLNSVLHDDYAPGRFQSAVCRGSAVFDAPGGRSGQRRRQRRAGAAVDSRLRSGGAKGCLSPLPPAPVLPPVCLV